MISVFSYVVAFILLTGAFGCLAGGPLRFLDYRAFIVLGVQTSQAHSLSFYFVLLSVREKKGLNKELL